MEGFISYSHEDHTQAVRLRVHLRAIERFFGMEFWWDERILPGQQWSAEIQSAIAAARVFVLAVTPDFIASNYIYLHEMPAIRAQWQNGGLVVPVILKPCLWEIITGPIQAVPLRAGRLTPVVNWPREDGLNKTGEQIKAAMEGHFESSGQSFDWKAGS
jgi:hypothetical protein